MTRKLRMVKTVSDNASFLHRRIIIRDHHWDYKKLQVTASRNLSVDLHLHMMCPQFKSIHKCNNRSKCLCRTTFLSNRCWPHHLITRLGSKVETIRMFQSTSLIKVLALYLLMLHFRVLKETPFSTWWKWAQYSPVPSSEVTHWLIRRIQACLLPQVRCLLSPLCTTITRRGTRLLTTLSSQLSSCNRTSTITSTIIPKWLMSHNSNKALIIICA